MEAAIENERLLLLITDVPPASPPAVWLPKLPYLSSLAERGTWAQVSAPTAAPVPAVWPSFAIGVAVGQGMDSGAARGDPFWRLLEEEGKRVIVHGAPPTAPPSQQPPSSPLDDPRHLIAEADWQFLMILHQASPDLSPDRPEGGAPAPWPMETTQAGLRGRAHRWAASLFGRGGKAPATAADDPWLRHWRRWDKEIAPLVALAAGAQTAVMVVGLPSNKGDDGLLVAGGGFIASIGDLGTIDLLDLPPTILWLLNVSPPTTMTGRVGDEIWQPEAGWTDEEQEALVQRLRGLGYLS